MTKKQQPLKAIFAYPNNAIDQLCRQINQQLAYLAQIKPALPKELANHVLHCVLKDKKMIVYTDSANWASQLRFYSATMLDTFKTLSSKPVSEIQIKITSAPVIATAHQKNKPIIPSATVCDEVHNQALMTADPELKQALEKLSSTLDRLHVRK